MGDTPVHADPVEDLGPKVGDLIGPGRPPCTRDRGSRLSIRAERGWLQWLARYAHSVNVPVALLVEKACEEFAATRGYEVKPPRRYVRALHFDQVKGEWTDEPPDGQAQRPAGALPDA